MRPVVVEVDGDDERITETLAARYERTRSRMMRDHPFVGDGAHCRAFGGTHLFGHLSVGFVKMSVQCGYPRDLHPGDYQGICSACAAGQHCYKCTCCKDLH